ncbi:hypothetical protein GA0111570_104101 [Raineyella antarctica]|uniref:SatD family (SatD) n=2 Tax=Raineyella antarctica TaxID=1577474 RepID=A0A1G6GMD3_9ACTN|nr:hypothetical protein GA0111570_104101 [Raineyella antarctica]
MTPFVVTADQRRSRRGADAVPAALDALAALPQQDVLLGFERTAGDEIQGLLSSAHAVVATLQVLLRQGQWRIGIGVGPVERPLPDSTRAARGGAYLAAREAIEAARGNPVGLAVRDSREDLPAEDPGRAGWQAETALLLWGYLLSRRSPEGWEVCDLLDRGLTNRAAAAGLGISPSAASQRAARAAYSEGRRGAALAAELLARAATEGAQ